MFHEVVFEGSQPGLGGDTLGFKLVPSRVSGSGKAGEKKEPDRPKDSATSSFHLDDDRDRLGTKVLDEAHQECKATLTTVLAD